MVETDPRSSACSSSDSPTKLSTARAFMLFDVSPD
jgi:hypothetical protein